MKYIIEFKDERTSVWQRSMLWDKQYEEAERDSILHGMGSTWRSVPAVDTSFDTAKRLREHLEWVLETLSYTSERLNKLQQPTGELSWAIAQTNQILKETK